MAERQKPIDQEVDEIFYGIHTPPQSDESIESQANEQAWLKDEGQNTTGIPPVRWTKNEAFDGELF